MFLVSLSTNSHVVAYVFIYMCIYICVCVCVCIYIYTHTYNIFISSHVVNVKCPHKFLHTVRTQSACVPDVWCMSLPLTLPYQSLTAVQEAINACSGCLFSRTTPGNSANIYIYIYNNVHLIIYRHNDNAQDGNVYRHRSNGRLRIAVTAMYCRGQLLVLVHCSIV